MEIPPCTPESIDAAKKAQHRERLDAMRALYDPLPLDGVIGEHTADGVDYTRVCARHQWCSVTSVFKEPPLCPECEAEIEAGRGRDRYRRLHARLTGGWE